MQYRSCAFNLGEKGEKLDDDIANLVKRGLNPTVQKSLDIVRVIGNEAVHPGVLDLKDDRDTAINRVGALRISLIRAEPALNCGLSDRVSDFSPSVLLPRVFR